jgi:hypothetical protein
LASKKVVGMAGRKAGQWVVHWVETMAAPMADETAEMKVAQWVVERAAQMAPH